jgi:hypothetical protein
MSSAKKCSPAIQLQVEAVQIADDKFSEWAFFWLDSTLRLEDGKGE